MTYTGSLSEGLRIIREPEVKRLTGLSRSQRWRLTRAGIFPHHVQLSERALGWVESEIMQWVKDRIAARDA